MRRDRRPRMRGRSAPHLAGVVLVVATLSLCMGTGVGFAAYPAARAVADPIGSCSTTTGVIVAVDFSHFGGNVERGCASTPTTGYQALQSAGFAGVGDERDGPAFICRITDPATGIAEPPPSEDPCITTPPATAYWSYWHAGAGQSTWSFSRQGAASYEPPPGSVDAWTFGAGNPPPFPPSAVEATNAGPAGGGATAPSIPASAPTVPAATPTTAVPAANAASAAPPGSAGTKGAAASPSRAATSPTSAASAISAAGSTAATGATGDKATGGNATAATTSVPGSGAGVAGSAPAASGSGASTSVSRAAPRIVDAAPASAQRGGSSGSPLLFAIGSLVVVVLAAGGGFVARRRRAASS